MRLKTISEALQTDIDQLLSQHDFEYSKTNDGAYIVKDEKCAKDIVDFLQSKGIACNSKGTYVYIE